ncbi:MAG: DUF937 domain-containing protein [Flavobacteriales bacterium]|nr:DUF937 domain-containing protein [Flavobacteriales bacterium]
MDLTRELMQNLGENGIHRISQEVGMQPQETKTAMSAIVPVLLGAMAQNSQSTEGANGLLSALDRDHDGSVLDDIGGFLGGAMQGNRSSNGSGILRHILGDKKEPIEHGLSNKIGVDSNSISKLMSMLAPLVMAYLGKQKRSSGTGGFDTGGLGGLLGKLAGGSRQSGGIDVGDIMDMMGGLSGSSKSSGGMLGGLLKGMLRRR